MCGNVCEMGRMQIPALGNGIYSRTLTHAHSHMYAHQTTRDQSTFSRTHLPTKPVVPVMNTFLPESRQCCHDHEKYIVVANSLHRCVGRKPCMYAPTSMSFNSSAHEAHKITPMHTNTSRTMRKCRLVNNPASVLPTCGRATAHSDPHVGTYISHFLTRYVLPALPLHAVACIFTPAKDSRTESIGQGWPLPWSCFPTVPVPLSDERAFFLDPTASDSSLDGLRRSSPRLGQKDRRFPVLTHTASRKNG